MVMFGFFKTEGNGLIMCMCHVCSECKRVSNDKNARDVTKLPFLG